LTEILKATMELALIHIRPDKWDINYVGFREDVLRAFYGSVAFARFLATYPRPDTLFTRTQEGAAS
jgi:hypothetical protein